MMSHAVVDVELDRQVRDDTVDGVEQFVVGRCSARYAYKRRFGVTRRPPVDISAALSWGGLPYVARPRRAGAAQLPKTVCLAETGAGQAIVA